MQSGDAETAIPLFDRVSAAARRTNDEDLLVLAGIGLGNCLIMLGDMAAALDSLDEAMLYVTAEVVAPQVAGLAYCSVISACMERSDLQRAAEWTRALAGWCDAQSGLVPYRGVCQIHRAEILHLLGSWTEAAEEAERARNRLASDSMIIGGARPPGRAASSPRPLRACRASVRRSSRLWPRSAAGTRAAARTRKGSDCGCGPR